jgi:hypothetical protein
MMKRTIIILCFVFWANLTLLTEIFATETISVEISLEQNAAPPLQSAANDLLNGLKKIFPNDSFILKNENQNPRRIEIVVNNKGVAESFTVSKINGGQGIRIVGADPLGAAYGVYALLEQYGCGFYLTYDTFPVPEKGKWNLPKQILDTEFSDAPLVKERYSFNWHNFLSGCSGWDLAQWKSWIDQCRKLRYNVIMVHAYGNNPMFTFEFKGISKPVGFLASTALGRDWGTPHVNDVRRMIGGEHFDNAVFGSPAALVPPEQRIETVQKMMKQVFSHAKSQGMKIAFQIDVDMEQSNPQNMITLLPDNAKIKIGNTFRPLPDTSAGQEFYTAVLKSLLECYPEITSVVVCTRANPQPGGFSAQKFPEHWQKEFEAISKNRNDLNNHSQLAAYFWTGKVAAAFQKIVLEIDRKDVTIAQASWLFKTWLPYADACTPKNVAFLPLDWKVVEDNSEFDSLEEIQWMRRLTDSGRRVVPIIWSHHDDGHYIGRTYTPYTAFASHLEKAGCDSYGIIHWLLRPHGLYFKSHSVQVWQATKDQPLEETCRTMARNIFGTENEKTGKEYLYDWIRTTPMYGRDTSDFMIDRSFSNDKFNIVQKDSQRRRELLAGISVSSNYPSAQQHLAYWKGFEEFNIQFWNDENSIQQSFEALKTGDVITAQKKTEKADPKSTIKKYTDYASQLGITSGDRGLLTVMNLKWFPAFTGLKQLLGKEKYRINFAPTFHEPLAQGSGHRSFFIDTENNLWLVQGSQELRGEQWSWSENEKLKTATLSDSEKEIVTTGITWSETVQIPIVPAMVSRFGSAKLVSPVSGQRQLSVYIADPTVKKQGDSEFDLILYQNNADSFIFDPVKAKYLRIVCHGNNSNTWNSIYELETPSRLKNGEVRASKSVQNYPADFACDGKAETRWAADGENEWILLELNPDIPFEKLQIRWYAPERNYRYETEISQDGQSWKTVTPKNKGFKSLPLTTVVPIPETAQVFRFTVPKEFQSNLSLGVEPKKGKASLCGLTLDVDQ